MVSRLVRRWRFRPGCGGLIVCDGPVWRATAQPGRAQEGGLACAQSRKAAEGRQCQLVVAAILQAGDGKDADQAAADSDR